MSNQMNAPAGGGNQRTIIIVVVVVLLLCCCCIGAIGAYYLYVNGDTLFPAVKQMSSLLTS